MNGKTPYQLAVETDARLIKGEVISRQERENIVLVLLESARPFSSSGGSSQKRELAPVFYAPEEGIKIKSLLGQTPKTKILAGNMVELEILRLLCLLAPESSQVVLMRAETLRRLKNTCFGYEDDGVGECFDASLVALRFLCAAAPGDLDWIQSRVDNYNRHAEEKKRPWFPKWYFWLCLSEMPMEIAASEIERHKKELLEKLRRSYVMHSEHDKTVHPVVLCMLRNLMARLPEYRWVGERQIAVSPKDGRLRLDLA